MRESWEFKNRRMSVEIVAPLQKHGTERMIGFKLSEYTRRPRYEDARDRPRSHSDRNGGFSVNFGQTKDFSIFVEADSQTSKSQKLSQYIYRLSFGYRTQFLF
jgi:hypothetical protein